LSGVCRQLSMTSGLPLERRHSALAVLLPETATAKDPRHWPSIVGQIAPHPCWRDQLGIHASRLGANFICLLLQAAAHHCSIRWALYALLYNFFGVSQMSKALNHQLGQVDSSTTVESPRECICRSISSLALRKPLKRDGKDFFGVRWRVLQRLNIAGYFCMGMPDRWGTSCGCTSPI
jgi:hypothetical protein